MSQPRIHLIATGGTIAGIASDPGETVRYAAGSLSAAQLVASVPPLQSLADLSVEQLWNLDSKDMTPEHWIALARATRDALARPEVDGVVITHGTDTMEESALFLDLVLRSEKPIVFTGAMRPATALSPDGPMMLYCAVQLATNPEARGLGVVAAMNNRIHAARHLRKAHPTALDAFSSGEAGALGSLMPVHIHRRPPVQEQAAGDDASWLDRAGRPPRVDLLLVGAGSAPDLLPACVTAGAQAVVLSLPGNCSLPEPWSAEVARAADNGVMVILASRTGEAAHLRLHGPIHPPLHEGAWLTPVQARVQALAGLWRSATVRSA